MKPFDEIVDSYMPAARVLFLSRAHVEMAVRKATRIERRCPSCQFSRARHDAVQVAIRRGVLDIFNRCCIFQGPSTQCRDWSRLELPQEVPELLQEVSAATPGLNLP